MSLFVGSLDLGLIQDYSALTITEVKGTMRQLEWDATEPITGLPYRQKDKFELMPISTMDVRHVERIPLGTKYAQVQEIVEARMSKVPQPNILVLDKTGVGVGVSEMFWARKPNCITISPGNKATNPAPREWHVPKRDLISPVQVRLQNGTLRIAKGLPHGDIMMRELLNFRVKISTSGHDTYEAWRENEHDDLVLSLALGAWMAEETFRRVHQSVMNAARSSTVPGYRISPI